MVEDEPIATSSNGASVESENGLVLFNGGLFDLKNLIEQVKRSETARESIEALLVDLRKQNNDLTVSNTRANTKIKDLSSDLKSYGRKLTDAEQSLSSSTVRKIYCSLEILLILIFILAQMQRVFLIAF